MDAQNKEVLVDISLRTEKAMEQTTKLVELLKEASSLANELASTLSNLELNIKI